MKQDPTGMFGPNTVRRMSLAYRYAHMIIDQRAPEVLDNSDKDRALAKEIVAATEIDRRLPRQLVRSLVDRFLARSH